MIKVNKTTLTRRIIFKISLKRNKFYKKMKYLLTLFVLPFLYALQESSYNSFIGQVGFCRLQSFDTVSRSTSESIPMFMDSRISFGVGLSDENMKLSNSFLCGACLNVTFVENFYQWNEEITEWNDVASPNNSFLVIVMDQCTDAVCKLNYLDFDIYSPTQPVMYGNPYHVKWHYVPCPIKSGETFEYIICTATTCHIQDRIHQTVGDIITDDLVYWSLTIRNTRLPISKVILHLSPTVSVDLRLENSWIWDIGTYNLQQGINITMMDQENKVLNDFIQMPPLNQVASIGYHGGIIVKSLLQN